jgi:16S rRNA (cytidine1402-2'-O)-methyltransferase
MPGILYVVATPIGNLEDLTFRALRVLREVAVIAAEDTRRTARLLQHYSISTRTTSLHEHNERAKVPGLIARLQAGASVALVSDAGTPLISDPGVLLVSAAHAAAIRVEPVPGASAALAAVSASGLAAPEILFVGFPPSRSNARKKWFERLSTEQRLLVFFEAPHRIRPTLEDALNILGDRPMTIGRELTKTHEELVVRPTSQHLAQLGDPRGEFTVVVAPPTAIDDGEKVVPEGSALVEEFGRLTEIRHGTRRDAVRELAARYQVSPKEMYRLLEKNRTDQS